MIRLGVDFRASISALRLALSIFHISVAVLGFWRPHMTEFVKGYAAFQAIAPTTSWAFMALVIGLGLLFLRRGTVLLILWQFFSASLFTLFAILVSGVYGPTWGTVAYTFPAVLSFLVMYFTCEAFLGKQRWYRQVQGRVRERRDG